ncbi:MAG: hypothetical protein R3Y36_04465 [Spirochaetales bacterium]
MKKTILTLTLLCVALTLHALDYRQVIFGNSYESIIEINADDFFEQYPEVSEHCKPDYFRSFSEHERDVIEALPNYYRVYEQVIGNDIFFRLLISFERYSDADLLNWQDIFFTQYVFYKESEKRLLQLDDMYLFGKENIAMESQYVYEGLEIIERNNTVVGLMRHQLSDYYEIENFAYYCIWEEARKSAVAKTDTIGYVGWPKNYYGSQTHTVDGFSITPLSLSFDEATQFNNVLLDKKRPFMYTIQNAFDGNPKTSYVEDSTDDLFYIELRGKPTDKKTFINCISIVNGYAVENYYKNNNQIREIEIQNKTLPYLIDSLSMQYYDCRDVYFYSLITIGVKDILPGIKYNDTPLAELDIYIDGEGWLFGGLE